MSDPVLAPIEPPLGQPAFRAAVEDGLAQADACLGTPFEEVAAWLETWGGEDETPPPA